MDYDVYLGRPEMLAAVGHSATPCDHEEVGCPGGYTDFYGGGIGNYPRFLERWSDRTLKYVGALVSIHISQHAVGTWSGRPDVKKGYTLTLTACRASTPVGGAPHPSPPHAMYSFSYGW